MRASCPSRGSVSELLRDDHVGRTRLEDDVEVAEVKLLGALLALVFGMRSCS